MSTWITDRRKTKNTSNEDKELWRMKRYLPCPFPKYMALKLYSLMTTKPEEVEERKKLEAERK